MPQLSKKTKFERGFKKWADDKAISIRNEIGLNKFAPLCAFELCKHFSIPVLYPKDVKGLSDVHLNTLLADRTYWSATTIPLPNNKYLIIHNPVHSQARQQSDLMHELAHIICEHKIPDEKKLTGLSGFLRNLDEEQENEAEWLGGCLQLPRPALVWAIRNRMANEDIANHYNCSIDMVRYRINITGVRKQLSYIT